MVLLIQTNIRRVEIYLKIDRFFCSGRVDKCWRGYFKLKKNNYKSANIGGISRENLMNLNKIKVAHL